MNAKVKKIREVTLWGMAANILLTIIKFVVGIIGSSQSVLADGVHSLSDIITDLSVIVGVKFWSAPPDEGHQYGHSKIESIVTMIIGIMLAAVAFGLSYEALASFHGEKVSQVGAIALIGPLISLILKEALFRWTNRVGEELKSSALNAKAWHDRTDAMSSVPALLGAGIAFYFPGIGFVDYIGAVVVSVFILKVAWDIIKSAFLELTDYGIDKKEVEDITSAALNVEGVEDVHAVRTRKSGSSVFVDMHVLVNPEISVRAGHDISTIVKDKLIEEFDDVVDVIVHLEPNE